MSPSEINSSSIISSSLSSTTIVTTGNGLQKSNKLSESDIITPAQASPSLLPDSIYTVPVSSSPSTDSSSSSSSSTVLGATIVVVAAMTLSRPFLVISTLSVAYIISRLVEYSKRDVRKLIVPDRSECSLIFGHELTVWKGQATEVYTRWVAKYGPFFRIKAAFGHSDIIVCADHAATQHIFADPTNYVKSPQFRPPIANLIGKGLVWAEGEDHANQRRLLAPAFTAENIKGMANDIAECAEKLESRLTNLVLSSDAGGLTVNIVEYMSMCTLDIIGRVAFGHDFQSGLTLEAREIASGWHRLVNTGLRFETFIASLAVRAFPFLAELPVRMVQAQGEVKIVVGKLVGRIYDRWEREREAVRVDGKSGGEEEEEGSDRRRARDLMSILLRASRKEGGLTRSQIIDNMSTLTMVGHETTAGSLNFTLLSLARNKRVQDKLRDEVISFGRDVLSYDDVQKLSYLDAVVKEGLRLHPASPQTERVAMKDDIIPLSEPIRTSTTSTTTSTTTSSTKSIHIQKGQVFHIPFSSMHLRERTWGKDAGEFRPERWRLPVGAPGAVGAPSELPRGWSGLATFCDGPRNCVGYRLAIFEFKIILATLIRSLEFHDTEAIVEKKISPTLQPVVDGEGGVLPLYITLSSAIV